MSCVAEALGVPPTTYGRYETERDPPGCVLAALERNTPIRVSWILTGEGEMLKPPVGAVAEEEAEYSGEGREGGEEFRRTLAAALRAALDAIERAH